MKTIRRILFAIRKPESARQPGLSKAIQVARAFGARLELFHAMHVPLRFPNALFVVWCDSGARVQR